MNFQEKLFETTAELRARAAALTAAALDLARDRANVAAKRVGVLKDAGRAFSKVAQHHGTRFVKENSELAFAAGKDVSAIARTTYATLAGRKAAKAKAARKPRATTRRAAKAA